MAIVSRDPRRGTMETAQSPGSHRPRRGEVMSEPSPSNEVRDAVLPCPICGGEMHPLFLYEDRDPDAWLCFSCGHVEWIKPGSGQAIPSVDQ